ncbi:MAG: glucokinase [Pseudomonadota bacterium]
MADPTYLIGDIGGTNARFALADGEEGYRSEHTLNCADFDSADTAMRHYLDTVGAPSPNAICLAAAGPVVDRTVTFTNNHWVLDVASLERTFAEASVSLINDFEAVAWAIPALTSADCQTVGLPPPADLNRDAFTVAATGPGTGLGAVGLKKSGGTLLPISGEASHSGFAPETQLQIEILKTMRERFDRVSFERLVSGPGIENLYWSLCLIHGEQRQQLSASEVFARAQDQSDPRAAEAVQVFLEILGQFAGDLALTLNAHDGVFIAGGIAKRYPELIENSRFRSGFEGKGRYRPLMERIPTQLITHDHPGLLGASYCALRAL